MKIVLFYILLLKFQRTKYCVFSYPKDCVLDHDILLDLEINFSNSHIKIFFPKYYLIFLLRY